MPCDKRSFIYRMAHALKKGDLMHNRDASYQINHHLIIYLEITFILKQLDNEVYRFMRIQKNCKYEKDWIYIGLSELSRLTRSILLVDPFHRA